MAVVLLSAHREIEDAVLSTAASLDVAVVHLSDPAELAMHWSGSPTVLIGADQAAAVGGLRLPARRGVWLLAGPEHRGSVAWSARLGAPVLLLPEDAARLPEVLGADALPDGQPPLLVLGASGGVGASTLAAGLAGAAARRGRSLLVDLDPRGGGLDLLVGAETLPGWRWDDLAGAGGDVGSLVDRLPRVDDVDVVAHARRPGRPDGPDAAAVGELIRTARRHYRSVVADVGRGEVELTPNLGGRYLLVVGSPVRGLAAATVRCRELVDHGHRVSVVLRRAPGSVVPVAAVEQLLGVAVIGEIGTDRRLSALAEQGAPPWGGASRRWRRRCDLLLTAAAAA